MSFDEIPGAEGAVEPLHRVAKQPEEEKKNKRGLFPLLLAILLVVAGVGIGVYTLWPHTSPVNPSDPNRLPDLVGNIIVPDDPSATDPVYLQRADMVVNDGGDGFVVPSLDIHIKIGLINSVDGLMNPPNFTSVFLIRNQSAGSLERAAEGTIFMVTHAVYGGRAPGNLLQSRQQTLLKPGDEILVNGLRYLFTEARIIPKTELGSHADIWDNEPGRLIIVTCQVRAEGGIAINNMVLIAHLAK